ncbi:phasin family protein [Paradesulfitobacterium ferrireducens]|uniref:phasin family protein n=1 Tax=Paradesulfitobacterium ferrireducens TaxID=2816476 RepID=UPI001A907660|nr:polyhydroxyalkanoate synthesis regulator [Paradesulfitobacterium ferrireducens]
MKDLLKKGLALGLGVAVFSKEQIEKVVDDLVKKGEVSAAESKELVNELIAKGEEGQKELQRVVREHLNKLLSELNIPTKEDIKRLEERLARLESKD